MAHKGFHFSICSCRCPKNVDHVANNGLQIWPQGWSEIRPPLKGFCTQLKLLKPWMCWMWISDLFHCFILAAALSHLSTGRSPASGNLANDGWVIHRDQHLPWIGCSWGFSNRCCCSTIFRYWATHDAQHHQPHNQWHGQSRPNPVVPISKVWRCSDWQLPRRRRTSNSASLVSFVSLSNSSILSRSFFCRLPRICICTGNVQPSNFWIISNHFKSFHQISNFLPFSSETARSATSHESQTLLPSSEPYGRNPTPSPQTPRTPTLRPVGVHQQLNSFNVKNRLPSPTSRRCVTEWREWRKSTAHSIYIYFYTGLYGDESKFKPYATTVCSLCLVYNYCGTQFWHPMWTLRLRLGGDLRHGQPRLRLCLGRLGRLGRFGRFGLGYRKWALLFRHIVLCLIYLYTHTHYAL